MPIGPYQNWESCKKSGTFANEQLQEDHYMGRNVDPQYLNHIIQRYEQLKAKGIPETEIQRAIMSEFAYGSHYADPWPPKIEGIDIVDRIYPNLIPAEAFPPYLDTTEHVAIPSSLNWIGTASKLDSQPSMHGEEAAMNWRQMPEESWYPWKVQEQQPRYAKFRYANQENCPICKMFDGMIFDLNNISNRPIVPSEGTMYTTTHPNCECRYDEIDPILAGDIEPSVLPADRKDHISHINRIIGQKSRYGSLHALNSDGSVSDATFDYNPRHIQETISELKSEFKWLSPEYVQKLHEMKMPGRFILIRAAAETVTDHRIEGEPYRRLLTGLELHAMARTATGKGLDINHNPEWRTLGRVIDSEGDIDRKEIQMLVHETDPQVLDAINNGIISAVSINGGAPRQQDVECDQECYLVPKGVILGELDGIALTYVVTDRKGMNYRGMWIPPAEPGVKSTALQLL